MCMTCGCIPCADTCVTLTLTEQQQSKINDLVPMLEEKGFHVYIIEDPNGMKHLCLTNALDENMSIDLSKGEFPYIL